MKAEKSSMKSTQKSDVIVFFLATMIVCALVGKGVISLCDTEYHSLLHEVSK